MIALVWQVVRARWASLAGSFVALALGVAVLTAAALAVVGTLLADTEAPRWFTRADVVVAGRDTATLDTGQQVRTAESLAVPAEIANRLSTLDATVVVDHVAYGTVGGAPGDTVHPWSAAELHGYAWESGGPPRSSGDVVLTAPTDHRPGDRVTMRTAAGPQELTVVGVLRPDSPAAFHTTDEQARDLAGGRIDAIAVTGASEDEVAAVVGDAPVRVLTGDQRREAEPDPDADLLLGAVILLGNTGGLAGFVAVFVVASTFSYAVAARRRELGLLRAAGATPRQVRRLVLGEALVVGVLAAGGGVALGSVLAGPFTEWFAGLGLAPSRFTARFVFWPAAAAFGFGLLVALLGAALPARRAGRVGPVEALREATVDRRAMTPTRWVVGLALGAGGVAALGVAAGMSGGAAMGYFLLAVLALITGCAVLAPALVPPLVSLLPRSRGAVGMLARANARTAIRRTAATAAPVLVTVALSAAVLAGTATLTATEAAAARSRITASAVVAGPLADATVEAIRDVPGVTAAVATTDTVVYVGAANAPFDWTGRYVDGPDLRAVQRIPVVEGTLAALTGTGTVAVPAGSWRLGETAVLTLADSTRVRLRVVAVFADQIDLSRMVLLPSALRAGHTIRPLADTVYLRLNPDADQDAIRATGATVINTASLLTAAEDETDRLNRLGMIAILGLSLLYTAIAIANTMVMATGARARDLATLRLSGATSRQVLRMIATEALLVTGVGVLLAAAVTGITVLALRIGLASRAPTVEVDVPWVPIGGITLTCLVIALLASLFPAAVLLRRRPAELAGLRE